MTQLTIDTTRLEKMRQTGNKVVARCPACAATGGDRSGNHFFYNTTDGKFGCSAFQKDTEHRREIFRLIGVRGERQPDPARDQKWREDQRRERQAAEARTKLIETAKTRRAAIVAKWRWHAVDVWEDSPTRIDHHLTELDPRFFIQSLFPQDAVVWTGEVFHSGSRHADRFRTVAEWHAADEGAVGPMVTPAIWKPGTVSRTAENVLAAPYTCLDFDELDGRKPETPDEIKEHVAASLAITRWLREGMGWSLAAVLFTGSKSVHSWFRNPGAAALKSLRDAAGPLGIDSGLVDQPAHPARLPGQIHAKTRGMSRVLWLTEPIS
jgi:hypothetical protein